MALFSASFFGLQEAEKKIQLKKDKAQEAQSFRHTKVQLHIGPGL